MKTMVKKLTLGVLGLFGFLALGFGTLGVATQADAQWDDQWGYTTDNSDGSKVSVVGGTQDVGGNKNGLISIIKNFLNCRYCSIYSCCISNFKILVQRHIKIDSYKSAFAF